MAHKPATPKQKKTELLKLSEIDSHQQMQKFFAQFNGESVTLDQLRDELAKELRGQSLSDVVRQMRAESNP